MISICKGDIFKSEMDYLVNPVNTVGIMGAGLAKEFKKRYPEMYKKYYELCKLGILSTGKIFVVEQSTKSIILFPTKKHWKSNSKIEYIEEALDFFVLNYKKLKIQKVAFPLLGCGLGGLNKDTVLPIMIDKLNHCDIEIEIYTFI